MKKKLVDDIILSDSIRMYLNGDVDNLSPEKHKILDRWWFAYEQLRVEQPTSVILRLQRRFGVSYSTAKNDISNARKVLNPINKIDVDFESSFLLQDAKEQMKFCRMHGDMKGWQKARQDGIKIVAELMRKQEAINPEMLGNNTYYVNLVQNNTAVKFDFDTLDKMTEGERYNLTDFLFPEIDSDERMKDILALPDDEIEEDENEA